MIHDIPRWTILVDKQRARLLRADSTDKGRFTLEEMETIQTDWVPSERGRPSPLSKKVAQDYASTEPQDLEELRHFARQAASWIAKKQAQYSSDGLLVVAPPRFLGELRKDLPKHSLERMHLVEGELAHLPVSKLLNHPALMQRLVSAAQDDAEET